jgi:hypothetical protein
MRLLKAGHRSPLGAKSTPSYHRLRLRTADRYVDCHRGDGGVAATRIWPLTCVVLADRCANRQRDVVVSASVVRS